MLSKIFSNNLKTKIQLLSSKSRPGSMMGQVSQRTMCDLQVSELTCTIKPEQFKQAFEEYESTDNVIFLDVREDEDCADGFLPTYNENGVKINNFRIPILDLIELRLGEIENYKDTHQILCYCRSGNKSVTATRLLNLHGFNVVNVKGGMKSIQKHIEVWKNGKCFWFTIPFNLLLEISLGFTQSLY